MRISYLVSRSAKYFFEKKQINYLDWDGSVDSNRACLYVLSIILCAHAMAFYFVWGGVRFLSSYFLELMPVDQIYFFILFPLSMAIAVVSTFGAGLIREIDVGNISLSNLRGSERLMYGMASLTTFGWMYKPDFCLFFVRVYMLVIMFCYSWVFGSALNMW